MDTKEKILLIAFKLFINNGYHNTSMQQLVDNSELSKGAFYHHFKSKNELYKQVINRYFLSFYKEVDWGNYQKQELTTQQIEKEIQKFYLNFVPQILSITENQMSRYYIMYFEAFTLLPEFKKAVQEFYKSLENLLKKATDQTGKSTQIIAKYEGIIFQIAIHPNLKIKALLKQVAN